MLDFSKIPDGPPIPDGYTDLVYGTVGFRANTDDPPGNLDHVAFRCGLLFPAIPFLSADFSVKYEDFIDARGAVALGVVVTASHNPFHDNGIKLFSPSGAIIDAFWEPFLTSFVNSRKPVRDELRDIFGKLSYAPRALKLNILIGWDTRPSCKRLVSHIVAGINATFGLLGLEGSKVTLLGRITTPSISYLLSSKNVDAQDDGPYLSFLAASFAKILAIFRGMGLLAEPDPARPAEELFFDCGHGVGSYKVGAVFGLLRQLGLAPVLVNPHTEGRDELLNYKSGAAYLLGASLLPESLKADFERYRNKRFVCFDGDVDRILYFVPNDPVMTPANEYRVALVDGDRLLAVTLMLLWTLVRDFAGPLSVGVFQTRYANSASVNFVKRLLAEYSAANPHVTWRHEYFRTGINNAQRMARSYDVALYFETNGHGNIILNRAARDRAAQNAPAGGAGPASRLFAFLGVFFPGGDAIFNCLVLELAFRVLGLGIADVLGLYADFPWEHRKYDLSEECKQLFVSSRSDDSVLVEPLGLHEAIAAKAAAFPNCRAFVRPSGTEPLLRVFVEAESRSVIDEVQTHIFGLIRAFLAGRMR